MSIDTQLPLMAKAFRTTVTGDGRYEMVFRFQSMDELHAADDEWRAARLASPPSSDGLSQVRDLIAELSALDEATLEYVRLLPEAKALLAALSAPSTDAVALREALIADKVIHAVDNFLAKFGGFKVYASHADNGTTTGWSQLRSTIWLAARQALSQPPTIAGTEGLSRKQKQVRAGIMIAQSHFDRLQKDHDEFYRQAKDKGLPVEFLMGYQHRVSTTLMAARDNLRSTLSAAPVRSGEGLRDDREEIIQHALLAINGLKSVIACKGRGFADGIHHQVAASFVEKYDAPNDAALSAETGER